MEFDIEKRFYPEEYQSSEEYRLSAYNSQYNQFLDYHSINKNKNHSLDTLNNEYDEYQDSFKPFTSAQVSSNKEDFFANRSSENMDKRIAFTNTRDSDLKIKVSKTKIFAIIVALILILNIMIPAIPVIANSSYVLTFSVADGTEQNIQ